MSAFLHKINLYNENGIILPSVLQKEMDQRKTVLQMSALWPYKSIQELNKPRERVIISKRHIYTAIRCRITRDVYGTLLWGSPGDWYPAAIAVNMPEEKAPRALTQRICNQLNSEYRIPTEDGNASGIILPNTTVQAEMDQRKTFLQMSPLWPYTTMYEFNKPREDASFRETFRIKNAGNRLTW
jgi:hypothetical protein